MIRTITLVLALLCVFSLSSVSAAGWAAAEDGSYVLTVEVRCNQEEAETLEQTRAWFNRMFRTPATELGPEEWFAAQVMGVRSTRVRPQLIDGVPSTPAGPMIPGARDKLVKDMAKWIAANPQHLDPSKPITRDPVRNALSAKLGRAELPRPK